MNTQSVLLSVDELDAVSGGMMNNGMGHLYAQPNSGGGRGGTTNGDNLTVAAGVLVLEAILVIGLF
jgi:hypothetical protein